MRRALAVIGAVGVLGLFAASCTPETPGPTNQLPTATASATPTSGAAPLSVSFSAAGSFDPDGSITTYSWSFGDGGTSNLANPSHTYLGVSTFEAILTVTDNGGATATDSVIVTTTPGANQSPVAAASGTPSSGNAPLSVQFDSTGSTDPDGSIVSFDWDFGDGSPNSSLPSPTHVYTSAGNFGAVLTVTDDDGATSTAVVSTSVSPNVSPTAAAVAVPSSGHAPLSVQFDSTGSTDPDGSIVSFDWDFGDGSPHSNLPSPTHVYTALGTITATLTVTDNGGATDTDTVLVQVSANQAPTAVATSDVSSGPSPLTVQFTGSASADTDGTIDSYLWDFGDGNTSSLADVPHTFATAGNATVTLTVTDNDGATDVATLVIVVGPPANVAPSASASATPLVRTVGQSFAFSSGGSTDSDGTIASYLWDFGDGNTSTAPNPSHAYTVAATYTVSLTVTDDDGASDTDTVQVAVVPNSPPNASASGTNTSGKAPLTVQFTGSASSDTDGSIAGFDWDFGDSTAHGTTADPSHVYTVPGNYTATLTVTDDVGATDTATVNVVVVANQPPVASLNVDVASGLAPLAVTFDSTASTDPDGTIVSRTLSFGDGSPDVSSATAGHTYTGPGTYTATLTVVDDSGESVSTTKTVTAIGSTVGTASGAPGSTILVTVPCEPTPGGPPAATAIAALVSSPGGIVAVTNSFDNGSTGQPDAVVSLVIPLDTAAGSYVVTSSCDRYMSSTQYAAVPFTVT